MNAIYPKGENDIVELNQQPIEYLTDDESARENSDQSEEG